MSTTKLQIIGITGKAGSGKDTVANYFIDSKNYIKLTFGGAVKDIVQIITGWSRDMIEGQTVESRELRETVVHQNYNMNCRQLMQFVGTDLFRNNLDQNVWINIVNDKVKKLILDINSGTQTLKHVKGIIISDVRFDNEAQFIKSIGGTIVKINRNVAIESSNHQSERGISIATDYVIENNTTIDDLYNQIDYIIYDMKHKK